MKVPGVLTLPLHLGTLSSCPCLSPSSPPPPLSLWASPYPYNSTLIRACERSMPSQPDVALKLVSDMEAEGVRQRAYAYHTVEPEGIVAGML